MNSFASRTENQREDQYGVAIETAFGLVGEVRRCLAKPS